MPRATVDLSSTGKKELKTCPGGWVQLRRMSWGQKLARQESAIKMSMEMQQGSNRSAKMDMDMMQSAGTLFDFQACIVDHNLEDEQGRKLNLGAMQDMAQLDPRIGEEISTFIDELNNYEKQLEETGFPEGSAPQS
jgi:hypothetical protein